MCLSFPDAATHTMTKASPVRSMLPRHISDRKMMGQEIGSTSFWTMIWALLSSMNTIRAKITSHWKRNILMAALILISLPGSQCRKRPSISYGLKGNQYATGARSANARPVATFQLKKLIMRKSNFARAAEGNCEWTMLLILKPIAMSKHYLRHCCIADSNTSQSIALYRDRWRYLCGGFYDYRPPQAVARFDAYKQ